MMIETVGVYSNTDLVLMACDVVIQCIKAIAPPVIVEGDSTMLHCYDIVMDIDYTVGKMIEYELYTHLFGKTISYVTFYKKHPHDTTSILRITCMEETPLEKIQEYLQAAYSMCISVLQDIQVKIRAL
jgi:DNA-directed RNA polymerase subunit L